MVDRYYQTSCNLVTLKTNFAQYKNFVWRQCDIRIEISKVYNVKKYFVTERLHHGLHGPNLAPRNTALFYEEEEEDIEDEDDIVDDDDDS